MEFTQIFKLHQRPGITHDYGLGADDQQALSQWSWIWFSCWPFSLLNRSWAFRRDLHIDHI